MYVMHWIRKWEEFLPLVEFNYNNGYLEQIKMSPFQALCQSKYNNPIHWSDPLNRVHIGLDMLKQVEQEMVTIRKNLEVA